MKEIKLKFFNLLRWSERYTKTDMVYLVGQSGWVLVGQVVIFISALVLAWAFANLMEPSDYGLYKYVVSVATIATITTLSGIGLAIAKSVTEGYEIVLFKLIKVQITYGLIGAIGLFAIAGYYLFQDNTLLASLFAVTAIWIPFYESFSGYQFLLQGKKDFKTQTFLRIGQRLLLTLLMVLAIFFSKNIVFITFIYFMTLTLTQFLVYRYTVRKYPMTNDQSTPYTKILSYGKHLSFQNIFFVGAVHLDKIIMFKTLGAAQLAIYFFATAFPNEIQSVVGNINSVAFPKLVNNSSIFFKRALLKKIAFMTLLLIIPVLIYIIIAPYLFQILFPTYTNSIFISQLYIGTILFIPANLLWLYFYAIEHKKAIWFGTFIGPGTLILGIIFLTPILGLIGAIIAIYIRYIVDLVTALIFFYNVPEDKFIS